MYKLWCSIPTVGNVDEDVIAFGIAVRRAALESAALLCDEYGELSASEKDSALLVGKVHLSNAMSGEPRAASFLSAAIRALAASDSDGDGGKS
jgi:hypothetical protein